MAKPKLTKKNAVLTAEVTEKVAGEETPVEQVQEETPFHVFKTTPAEVVLRKGITLNKGNFESVRVEVGVSMPCYSEQLEDTFVVANAWTDAKLEEFVKKYSVAAPVKKTLLEGKLPNSGSNLPF